MCSGMEVCSGVGMCEAVLCSHTPPPPPQTDRKIDRHTQTVELMNGLVGGWLHGLMDGWMDG